MSTLKLAEPGITLDAPGQMAADPTVHTKLSALLNPVHEISKSEHPGGSQNNSAAALSTQLCRAVTDFSQQQCKLSLQDPPCSCVSAWRPPPQRRSRRVMTSAAAASGSRLSGIGTVPAWPCTNVQSTWLSARS